MQTFLNKYSITLIMPVQVDENVADMLGKKIKMKHMVCMSFGDKINCKGLESERKEYKKFDWEIDVNDVYIEEEKGSSILYSSGTIPKLNLPYMDIDIDEGIVCTPLPAEHLKIGLEPNRVLLVCGDENKIDDWIKDDKNIIDKHKDEIRKLGFKFERKR